MKKYSKWVILMCEIIILEEVERGKYPWTGEWKWDPKEGWKFTSANYALAA